MTLLVHRHCETKAAGRGQQIRHRHAARLAFGRRVTLAADHDEPSAMISSSGIRLTIGGVTRSPQVTAEMWSQTCHRSTAVAGAHDAASKQSRPRAVSVCISIKTASLPCGRMPLRASALGGIAHGVPICSCPATAQTRQRGSFVRLPETIGAYRVDVPLLCCLRASPPRSGTSKQRRTQFCIQHGDLPVQCFRSQRNMILRF